MSVGLRLLGFSREHLYKIGVFEIGQRPQTASLLDIAYRGLIPHTEFSKCPKPQTKNNRITPVYNPYPSPFGFGPKKSCRGVGGVRGLWFCGFCYFLCGFAVFADFLCGFCAVLQVKSSVQFAFSCQNMVRFFGFWLF